MNLKALQSLVAIYETESFGEAARRLRINQSSVSMQMKALEEELGAQLFDRSVRPPAMTPSAVAIVKSAREIVALANAIKEVVKYPAGLAGRLDLGVIPTATVSVLPDSMVAIGKRFPEIQILVQSGVSEPLIENVRLGNLDAAIVTEPIELPEGLRSEVIFRERLALVVAADAGIPPTLDQLSRLPFIRFNRRVGVGQIINRYLLTKGLQPGEFMELDSVEAILAMVERGLGVAVVPERTVDAHRARVALRPLDDIDAARNVAFIFRSQTQKLSILEAVLAALRQTTGMR